MSLEILLATYNSALYLDAQIQSLFEQTFTDFTLIVRDNQSTDTTVEQIKAWQLRFPGRIQLYSAPQHGDALHNFSALLDLSQADYVAFCDSDDVWHPTKLSASFNRLEQLEALYNPEAPCLVYTDLTPTDANLRPLASSFLKTSGLPRQRPTFVDQLMRNRITGCTILCNRALVNLARPIPQEAIMHDAWLGLIAAAFGHIDLLNKPTLFYRQHSANTLGMVPATGLKLARFKKLPLIWKRRHKRHPRFAQAELFLKRYQHALSLQQQEAVKDFLALSEGSFFQKLQLMRKHRFYEPTWSWTLYSFLFRMSS